MRLSALFGFWGVSTLMTIFLQMSNPVQSSKTNRKTLPSTEVKEPKPPRDWFGYTFSAVIGLVVTVAGTWYQLNVSDKQAAAAEIEKARAVRQHVIAIVEEQALSGKKLEAERITRLIDQRRREQNVSLPVLIADVVEQAELNIASSTYLDVERKEQIKPTFNAFYSDRAARSFKVFPPGTTNVELLNELAKQIQDGKTTEALASIRRLQELHSDAISQLAKKSSPTVLDAFVELFKKPLYLALLMLVYAVAMLLLIALKRRRRALRPWLAARQG